MNVKPGDIAAAYDLLRQLPPFCKWALPKTSQIKFFVIRDPKVHALYGIGDMDISVNADTHTTLQQLLCSVAHEMIHLRQELIGELPEIEHHNAAFRRMRKQVCQQLGFDIQNF